MGLWPLALGRKVRKQAVVLVPGALSDTPSITIADVPIGIPNIIITLVAFLAITWRKVDVALVTVAAMAMGIVYTVVHNMH